MVGSFLPQRVPVGETYGIIVFYTYIHVIYIYKIIRLVLNGATNPVEPGQAGKKTLRSLLTQSL